MLHPMKSKFMDTYIIRKQIHRLPGKVIHNIPIPQPEVVEGHASRKQVGEICRQCGYKQVLVVTDKTLSQLGYEQAITQSLNEAGINCSIFNKINSEPTIAIIEAARKTALESQAECIVALGGGSVMDTCKMVAAGVKIPHLKVKTLLLKFLPVPDKTLPIIAVPSTAGTGAEVTVGAVVTNSRGTKSSTVLIGLNVTHVILDSELTIHAPQQVTAACGIGVKLILQHLPTVMKDPENIEARLGMCRAAMYGGHAINTQLAGYVHAFAHSIGAKYHIPHGQAISLMLLPVLEYQKDKCLAKYAMLARYCKIADGNTNDTEAADLFLQAIRQLMAQCGMDKLVSPVKACDHEVLTRMIVKDSINYSAPFTFSNNDIEQVLNTITPKE